MHRGSHKRITGLTWLEPCRSGGWNIDQGPLFIIHLHLGSVLPPPSSSSLLLVSCCPHLLLKISFPDVGLLWPCGLHWRACLSLLSWKGLLVAANAIERNTSSKQQAERRPSVSFARTADNTCEAQRLQVMCQLICQKRQLLCSAFIAFILWRNLPKLTLAPPPPSPKRAWALF